MFSHICKTYYPLFLPCCTYVSSVMRSSWHFNTSGFNVRFPRTPQNDFFGKNIHQITSIFYILLSFGVILRCLWGLEAYIYTMFMSSVDQVYWFRATGGYICGCGRPSNLVYHWKYMNNCAPSAWICSDLLCKYLKHLSMSIRCIFDWRHELLSVHILITSFIFQRTQNHWP